MKYNVTVIKGKYFDYVLGEEQTIGIVYENLDEFTMHNLVTYSLKQGFDTVIHVVEEV